MQTKTVGDLNLRCKHANFNGFRISLEFVLRDRDEIVFHRFEIKYSRVPFICSFLGDEDLQILHIIGKILVEVG